MMIANDDEKTHDKDFSTPFFYQVGHKRHFGDLD